MSFPDADPDVYLDLIRDQLGYQLAAADAVEAKTGTWFAVGSTLMGLLVALVALRTPTSTLSIVMAGLAAAAYVGMAATVLIVLFGSRWGTGPDLGALEADRLGNGWGPTETKWVAFVTTRDKFLENKRPYRWRLWSMRLTAATLALEVAALGALALATARG